MMEDTAVHLKAISIMRDGHYYGDHRRVDPSKPLRCTVEVEGDAGKTELSLPPEVSERIVALIADELANSARRVAETMTAKFVEAGAQPLLAGEVA